VVQIVLWYLDSGCSKHMIGDRSQLTNFVHKFLGTVKFGNDQIAKIVGYGDYQIGNITILRVYYVEGLGHNLFSVGQFCDSDLEVAFRKHTCFVCNLEGVDLLSKSQETNLYTLPIGDMMASSPICLFSKASKTKSCKKQSHKPKSKDTNQEKLYLLHMDLCGPMRVASVNRKKYIIVIVGDYSRFTWVKFLASNDEAHNFIIKFLKMIQVRLNATVKNIRTDNETEFVNQTLQDYYEQVGISHETSVARTPQQNGVVERRNRTLVEAARIFIGYAPKKIAYRIYNRRTRKIIETIHVDFDELVAMAFEQLDSGPGPQYMTPATPMFDEFFYPLASIASPDPVEEAPAPVESTCLLSSTTVDQDVPSLSTSQTTPQSQSQTIPFNSKEESHDLEVAHMSNDPYFGIINLKTIYEESLSSDVIPTTVHLDAPISEHLSKWTKDHPLQNIIGNPSRPVSTRLQLHEQALFCYYDVVRNTKFLEKSQSLHKYW
ncbi:retrovirus-related pol polyprotein from transposon TNT 1-94, partial [Tanacetum coccineum]